MKIFLYVIVFMLILCPIRSYAVEVGPDFNGIRLGTNINNIKNKLYKLDMDENIKIPEQNLDMLLYAKLRSAQDLSKYIFKIKEEISEVLYYKISERPSRFMELYINKKGEVVSIRLHPDSIKKIFKTVNKNEFRDIFNKKYNAKIYYSTDVDFSDSYIQIDKYYNSDEKWKTNVQFNNKQKAINFQIFRYEPIENITTNNLNNEDHIKEANQSTNKISSLKIEENKYDNHQNNNTKISNNELPQNKVIVKDLDRQPQVDQKNTGVATGESSLIESFQNVFANISDGTMLKLIIVLAVVFLIIFMVYGFILWKQTKIYCFFTGWVDYLIVFFAIISVPLIYFIFYDSNNEHEIFIMKVSLVAVPATLIFISTLMTFFTNYKYGSGIFLSLYAAIYKLICIIFIVLIIICLISNINARAERKERLRRLMN